MNSIPKIIHYCWFGKGDKPQNIITYIEGWKRQLTDYDFIEWNEENFDVCSACEYVKEAYAAKKYAFVSDYVRIKALYEYGGIYLDTDVAVLKPFDNLLEDAYIVTGFESERSLLTAFIACKPKNDIIKTFLDSYECRHFRNEDGSYDMTVINKGFSELLERNGIDLSRNEYQKTDSKIVVYPIPVFCGFDVINWHPSVCDETRTVHYMNSSWVGGIKGKKMKLIYFLQNILGYERYDKLKALIK